MDGGRGGQKAVFAYGATDDYGYYALENKMHINDLHATILHILGMDHERLTFPYAGRDFRLTDIAAKLPRTFWLDRQAPQPARR